MRKTYGDGTVVEGTPEEIRQYDDQRGVAIIPMTPGAVPIGKYVPLAEFTWPQQEACLVEAFRAHPAGVNFYCSCPRCSPSCVS